MSPEPPPSSSQPNSSVEIERFARDALEELLDVGGGAAHVGGGVARGGHEEAALLVRGGVGVMVRLRLRLRVFWC